MMMTADKESSLFDEYYFQHGCGRPYQRDDEWLDFFGSIADRIVKDFQPKTVLDAGCALGFLVEGLRDRGVEAFGFDISDYAISNVHKSIKDFCEVGSVTDPFPRKYDVIVCIEVLEHLQPQDSYKAIENICSFTEDVLFSSTPFDFKEATHFNVQSPEVWAEHFARYGFLRDVDYDASFITEWAVRFVKKQQPLHRTVKDFERRYWSLSKETSDLRELVNEMRDTISAYDDDIRSHRDDLKRNKELGRSKEIEIARLKERVEEIESSMAWAVFRAMQRVRGKLAPHGSARHRFLHRIFWGTVVIKQRIQGRILHKPSRKISVHEDSSEVAPAELEPLDEPRKSPETGKSSGSIIHSS
jgi:SAM-dependent methyltransferase